MAVIGVDFRKENNVLPRSTDVLILSVRSSLKMTLLDLIVLKIRGADRHFTSS